MRLWYKTVVQDCRAKLSYKAVVHVQGCRTRLLYKAIVQGRHTRLLYKAIVQRYCARLSYKGGRSSHSLVSPQLQFAYEQAGGMSTHVDALVYVYKLVHSMCVSMKCALLQEIQLDHYEL